VMMWVCGVDVWAQPQRGFRRAFEHFADWTIELMRLPLLRMTKACCNFPVFSKSFPYRDWWEVDG
jgi:hypothetical protein